MSPTFQLAHKLLALQILLACELDYLQALDVVFPRPKADCCNGPLRAQGIHDGACEL